MNFTEGILLGLGTGAVCIASCGPVLIPYLMGENKNIGKNFSYVFLFLLGRLAAYATIGLVAGMAGTLFLQSSSLMVMLMGISYIVLSVLLILYGFHRFKEVCLGGAQRQIALKYFKGMPYMVPLVGGVLTGLNVCPPLILAVTRAAATHSILNSLLFFIMFFMGTTAYFIPLPLIGMFKKQQVLRAIGKYAAILAGIIYLYKGVVMTFN
jgi:sulfite exporter TauE/SafE